MRKGLVLICIFSLTATFQKVKAQAAVGGDLAYTDEIENAIITKVGLNLGGGVEFDIDAPLKPFGQLDYSIIDTFDQPVIVAGVRFPLNF